MEEPKNNNQTKDYKNSNLIVLNSILVILLLIFMTTLISGQNNIITANSITSLDSKSLDCYMIDKETDSTTKLNSDLCCKSLRSTCNIDNINDNYNPYTKLYVCENNYFKYFAKDNIIKQCLN